MVMGLVSPEEQEKLCKRMVEYYRKLYPGIDFKVERAELSHKQLGELLYTYPGEESEATSAEKMQMISSAIGHGYSTPILLLRKNGKDIILDGHRRVRVAYAQGLPWKAIFLVPSKPGMKFGMEAMVLGKVKDLFGKV